MTTRLIGGVAIASLAWSEVRVVLGGVIGWLWLNAGFLWLADGYLPFDQPANVGMPFALRAALPSMGLVEQLALMALVWRMTRHRIPFDMATRAPGARRTGPRRWVS
jgi:hypothetical protein